VFDPFRVGLYALEFRGRRETLAPGYWLARFRRAVELGGRSDL